MRAGRARRYTGLGGLRPPFIVALTGDDHHHASRDATNSLQRATLIKCPPDGVRLSRCHSSAPPAAIASAGAMDSRDQTEAVTPATAGSDHRPTGVGLSPDPMDGAGRLACAPNNSITKIHWH